MKNEGNLETGIKPRIDYRFYSNVLNVNVTGSDVFIDFMQYPPENNEAPTVRIYLSHEHLKSFHDVLESLPLIQEKNQDSE